MTIQFDRMYELQVDSLVVTDLDIEFQITRTLTKTPNTARITVYNLNPDHRQQLGETKHPVVQLKAGYRGRSIARDSVLQAVDEAIQYDSGQENLGLIFRGDVRNAPSTYQSPDWMTVMESGDGERAHKHKRVNRSFAKGARFSDVLAETAKSLGVGIGNLKKQLSKASLTEFQNGIVVSGASTKQVDRLIRSAGLEWSVQNSEIQVLELGSVLEGDAVYVSPETGLISTPTIDHDGVARFDVLLNSRISPGRQILLDSKSLRGRFRAERCDYSGATFNDQWMVGVEGKRI